MSKKRRDRHKKGHRLNYPILFDLWQKHSLTVGQVIRKNEEVEYCLGGQ